MNYVRGSVAGFASETMTFVAYHADVARRIANPAGWAHAAMSQEALTSRIDKMQPCVVQKAARWGVKALFVGSWFDTVAGTGVHRVPAHEPASFKHSLPFGGWNEIIQDGRSDAHFTAHQKREQYLDQRFQQTRRHFDDCGLLGLYLFAKFMTQAVTAGFVGTLVGAAAGVALWGAGKICRQSWGFKSTVGLTAMIGATLGTLADPLFLWPEAQAARMTTALFKATAIGVGFATGLLFFGLWSGGETLWHACRKAPSGAADSAQSASAMASFAGTLSGTSLRNTAVAR